jgi:hypothetical protein
VRAALPHAWRGGAPLQRTGSWPGAIPGFLGAVAARRPKTALIPAKAGADLIERMMRGAPTVKITL